MRNAYALLGICFIIVFGSAYLLYEKAEAPTIDDSQLTESIDMSLSLTSPVFNDGEFIPDQFTCEGENVNPPLNISGVPEGTKSLVLVMDDSDIPNEVKERLSVEKFNHWAVYNIPPLTNSIATDFGGLAGLNSRGDAAYTGPCPPTEYEPTTHRYSFRLYAIDGELNFIKAPTLDEIETAVQSMVLEKAELTGLYTRVRD